MPITTALTATAVIAGFINFMFFLRALDKRQRLHDSGQNGELARIANAFVRIWATVLIIDILIILAGLGLLTGFHTAGYLLAGMPVGLTFIGLFALKGLLND